MDGQGSSMGNIIRAHGSLLQMIFSADLFAQWDDYTIVVALIFSWGPNILNIVATKYGHGRHIVDVSCADLMIFFKVLYAFTIIYYLALGLVKASIILFQYRIFPIIHYRRILLGCNIFVACWLVSCLLTSILQCIPVHNFWRMYDTNPQCIKMVPYLLISGGINTATNFILLAMVSFGPLTMKPELTCLSQFHCCGISGLENFKN